jgi:hypothetical protein
MLCCHDVDELAGQYKFGDHSGGCVAVLGVIKLMMGLALSGSMM